MNKEIDINLEQDYADLLDLRNRVKVNAQLFEEDHITLDHALDSLEILMGVIRIINVENTRSEIINKLIQEGYVEKVEE